MSLLRTFNDLLSPSTKRYLFVQGFQIIKSQLCVPHMFTLKIIINTARMKTDRNNLGKAYVQSIISRFQKAVNKKPLQFSLLSVMPAQQF